VLDSVLDRFQPTRKRPEPALETAGTPGVVLGRGAAAAIDLAVCYFLLEAPALYIVTELFTAEVAALGLAAVGLSLAVLVPVYLTYSFAFEWLYGRTPGKVNRGLVVVTADGGDVGLRAAAVRNLLRYVDLVGVPPLVLGLVVALVADGRRVGDLAAGTRVARIRETGAADTTVGAVEGTEAGRADR